MSRVRPPETRGWPRVFAIILTVILAGCGSGSIRPSVSGSVSSGEQPIIGASVQIYATGTAGDGSAATPLLGSPVKTDETGSFKSASLHSCPSPTSEVYLVSTGGSPADLGVENPAATLMTMLGSCSSLARATSVRLNEVTTIASVYAMAPYMSGPGAIGSSTGDAQALVDAAKMASELANLETGGSPGSVPAGEVAPTDKLNTLANLVNRCVDSTGGSAGDGSSCGNLFQDAGGKAASPARETMSAVLAIAKAPTVNVESLYQLAVDRGAFEPALNSAPADWRLQLIQTPPAPAFSPVPGAYDAPQTVTLSDGDASAAIFYTTDRTTPTAASTRYSGGISVEASTTISALAIDGGLSSTIANGDFTLTPLAPPVFSLASGSYTSMQSVSLSDSNPSAILYYTTDGGTPSATSIRYSGAISLSASATIRSIAIAGSLSSVVASATYTITPPPAPDFSPAPGAYSSSEMVSLSDGDASTAIYYTTDGSMPSSSSLRYAAPIAVSTSEIIRTIAVHGTLSSAVATGSYSIAAPIVFAGPVAQKLAFLSAPTDSSPGVAISPAITVIAEDASGNPVTGFTAPVTLTIGNNPGGAVLQGTTSANAGASAATFSGLSLSQPGEGYTLIASSPGMASATSGMFNVAAAPSQPATVTYYVSNSGADANPGTTASAPWKTIAQVNKAKLAPGSQVLFQSTSVWHEQLTAQPGVTYGPYGPAPSCTLSATLVASCTNMPVIDGADVVNGWSSVGRSTFKAAYSGPVSKAFVDAIYGPTTPLTLVSDAGVVGGTPGSVYGDGQNVYVHLADGSNPANHTIEVSGARLYGVLVGGPGNVTINGLEIIRTAKSGYLNYSFAGTGASNVVENSVFFNIGDSLPDQNMGGPIEGAILSVGGHMQTPVTGFSAANNWVGQMDVPHDTLNYSWAGIQVDGMAAAQVTKNKVATMNGWAIRIQDYFNNSCTAPVISSNETVNSEGNIAISGCPQAVVENNSAHNSFGNGLEAGPGLRPTDLSTGLYVGYNDFEHLRPAYNNQLYNGIDINFVAGGTAVGNNCLDVAFTCMTLEADNGPSSGWTVTTNSFDASQNVYADGSAPNSSIRVYPFYIRDTSLAGGLTMSQNTMVVNPASPYIKYGAASATDQTHDLTQPQFDIACPGCEVPSH